MDDVHREEYGEAAETRENAAVADDTSSEEDGGLGEATGPVAAAVAGDASPPGGAESGDLVPAHAGALLSAGQAEAIQEIKTTTAALQEAIESMRAVGALRAMQHLENELAKHRRRERQLARVARSRGCLLPAAQKKTATPPPQT